MRKVRVVSVAAALAAALLAAPALANGQSNSVLNNPAFSAAADDDQGAVLGTWIPATQVAAGRGVVRYAHAQCPDNTTSFYTISGVSEVFAVTNVVSRFDADTNTWASLANFPSPQEGPSAVCYQNKIYVAGGGGLTQFFIYDIAANTWAPGAALPRPMWGAAMGAWQGKVYMIGGDNDFVFGGTSNVVNIYDIATNTWTGTGAPMPGAAVTAGFATIGSFVYVVGGWNDLFPNNVNVTQRYDMATNTWTTGPTFTSARSDLALSATRTALYAIGGDANLGSPFNATTVVERLDVSTWPAGAWTLTDPLPGPLTAMKGGYCTQNFAGGEVFQTNGYTGAAVSRANQYLVAEPCPVSVSVAPTALEVDPAPAGNRVLEPNEASVIVAPSWQNTSASAIAALTGAATNFTGPVGPTYTIDNATASYGALAAGATASCTATGDCYAVTVTSATRPSVHWDSTITETVTPPGTVKNWTLHVGGSFTDVLAANPFYRFVETILHKGVTGGCTATTYCPVNSTTREQMAVFVLISKEGAGYTPPACAPPNLFSDVPDTSPFCRFIEEIANRGVVSGCGPNLYCPTAPATREQMAIFVLRTLDPALNPPACAPPNLFLDVPETSPFCRWIEELANRGVVSGCGGSNYCPIAAVTREQMGVFLALTFGLTLYGV